MPDRPRRLVICGKALRFATRAGAAVAHAAMEPPAACQRSFDRLGPASPATPLVISVPHAGRDYPPPCSRAACCRRRCWRALEDRFADRSSQALPALGATVFIARRARAWIDLNRDERELDAAMIVPPPRADRLDRVGQGARRARPDPAPDRRGRARSCAAGCARPMLRRGSRATTAPGTRRSRRRWRRHVHASASPC